VQFYGRSIIRLFWPVIRVRIENAAEVRQIEPCIYVLNHFSFVDVFFCGFLPGHQTVVAIRSWPFKIPIFNFFMRWAEYRDVEASTPEEILTWAKAMLESGVCLLFFPEGHRARAGRMLPLHKGAFRIAAENNVPIVPVTIQGTEYLGGGKSRLLTPCRVKMRFHPPVEAEGRSPATIIKLLHHVEALYKREVYGQPVWTQPSASKET
jgi:1-acyl-sn-glycerol-3-phosphate acyltransferase